MEQIYLWTAKDKFSAVKIVTQCLTCRKKKDEVPVIFAWMKVNSFTAKPHSAKETGSECSNLALQSLKVLVIFAFQWSSMGIRGFVSHLIVFLQLKKERKWWRVCCTVMWQQWKKKFCLELDKRFPLVGVWWGKNAMQTLRSIGTLHRVRLHLVFHNYNNYH